MSDIENKKIKRSFFSSLLFKMVVPFSALIIIILLINFILVSKSSNNTIQNLSNSWLKSASYMMINSFDKEIESIKSGMNNYVYDLVLFDFFNKVKSNKQSIFIDEESDEESKEILQDQTEQNTVEQDQEQNLKDKNESKIIIDRLQNEIEKYIIENPEITGYYILDNAGETLFSDKEFQDNDIFNFKEFIKNSSNKEFNLESESLTFSNDKILILAIHNIINSFGNIEGFLIFEINLKDVINKVTSYINIPYDYIDFILINKFTKELVYHSDKSKILAKNNKIESLINSIEFEISKMDTMNIYLKENEFDPRVIFYFSTSKDNNWYLGLSLDKNEFAQNLEALNTNSFLTQIFSIILIIIIIFFLLKTLILNKLNVLEESLSKVLKGHLSQRMNTNDNQNDEISRIMRILNNILEKLLKSWVDILSKINSFQSTGNLLDENIISASDSIQDIYVTINKNKTHVNKQSEYVNETSTAIEEISRNLDSLNDLIEQQVSSVNQSSTAIEELIASIKSITTLTEEANTQVSDLSKLSNEGQTYQNELVSQIRIIAQTSEHLHEANNLIASMADQTNLLSMNAAIEAAHAGEAGRGFAVVAEEIRNLAEQVSEQSDSVSETIYQIQQAIDQVVKSAETSSNSFQDIINQMDKVTSFIANIQQAMQEQTQGTQQILSATTSMKDISQNVRNGSREMSEGASQILESITGLNESNKNVQNITDDMSNNINKILDDIKIISDISTRNKDNIKKINDSKDQFYIKE